MSVSRFVRLALVVVTAGFTIAQIAPAAATDSRVAASATSVYVATNGSDTATAGASASPFRTIQYAVTHVASGGSVHIASGTYAPFKVTTPNVAISGHSRTGVVVRGAPRVQGVVTLAGAHDQVSNLTVTGCVPNPAPSGSFEYSGSASVLVTKTAPNAVVSNLTITHGSGTNSYGLPFGCFGVYVGQDTGVTISGNDIIGQGEGIFLYRGGDHIKILSNVVHANRVEIRNTTLPNDDFGGTGIGLFETTGNPGPLVDGNTLAHNFAPSHDYGTDGGAFDLFQASDATLSHNIAYDNDNILETGAGSATAPCANNVFTGNTLSGRSVGSALKLSVGMILRCATNMRITNNTFTKLDNWTFDIEQKGNWTGALANLSITGNRMTQTYHVVYALLVKPSTVGMTINANHYTTGGPIGLDWLGQKPATLQAWRAATGMDSSSSLVLTS